jgi:uncharacterized protein YndB with AHSA1/START domain
VDTLSLTITISRPREEVFEYLADIANHAEFSDHYLKDWHLTRVDSYGQGAGARFRAEAPFQRFAWGDLTFIEVKPPFRIQAVGRGGKFNRVKTFVTWTLNPAPAGATRVDYTVETEPVLLSDRIMESFGLRGWFKRKGTKALKRLRLILEEGEGRGQRPTIAGL